MLLALVLLGVVGACAGLAFLSEESLGNLRAKAFEAKRWVLLKLDSLGQPPDIDSDCDCDLETGFGEAREALVDNGKRAPVVQISKPVRPIRRSVHRGQGGGAISSSTHVSTSPPSEYGGLYDRTPDKVPHELRSSNSQQKQQQQHQQQAQQQEQQQPVLPRPPLLATAMSLGGGRPPDGKSRAPLPHHSHRRGMSFDVNAAASVDTRRDHHHETSSARGSFALPRSAFPDAATNGDADTDPFGGDGTALPANLVAAFGGGGAGGGGGRGTVEQQIPVYIPVQKKGSLSTATHRRSSSRGPEGGILGGAGGTGSAGRSASPPDSSPFRCTRSPPKVLPPVPAFAGAGVGGGDLAAAAPPPPPPPSWNVSQDRGSGGGGGGAAVAGAGAGFYEGGYRELVPGRSPRQCGGSGAVISPVPFAPDRQSAAPTTPKQGQQQQQQQEEVPSGRGSSFFAGPSPDGDNSFSHIDYVANYVADSMAGGEAGKPPGGSSFWDVSGGGSGSGGGDAYDKQRDERAPISVLPASPAWSADDDVNRGTGVRRRVSPRAAAGGGGGDGHGGGGMSPRAGGGMSPRAGGGFSPRAAAGGGGRSPRRAGAGWVQPVVSPRRRNHGGSAGGWGGNPNELRPLALAFSEEGGAAGDAAIAAPAVAPHQGARGLRIDVGDAEEQRRVIVGATGPADSARARAETPLAGSAAAAAEAGKKKVAAVASTVAAAAEEAEAAAGKEAVVTESTVRQVGLRCSSPIYDRGRNMLGTASGGGRAGDGRGEPLPPTEKRGGGVAGRGRGGGGADVSGGSKRARSAVQYSRGTEARAADGAAAVVVVEESTLGRVAEEPRASARGGGKHQKATGEHARQGRDLSSSEAFAASLDLPFDQLELSELIGGGGFGQVYRGVWRGTPVAVKVLVPVAQRDLDEELAADFRAEVLMLAALRHPNVCLFMGACMVPPNRAIVTELLTRGSLWEALRADRVPAELASASAGSHQGSSDGGPDESSTFLTPQDCWPWSVVVKVAEGVACGMWYLHQHEPFPILHRDLKSANLLLDECFNVKICDFGLARLKAFTTSATMTGNCGTVQWMAPEVLASEKYAEPADVYSFAIVCWELLSRACPYDGMSQIQVAVAVLNDGLRPEIPKWCPRKFASLIKNGWEQDPNKRPSFGDVLEFVRKTPTQTCS